MCRERGQGNESESSRRMMNEFLVQMQGVGKTNNNVLVLGATNVPWEIDMAMRRRFEKRIYIPLPEAPARSTMFQIHTGKTQNNLTEADFMALGERTEGFSGSDVATVVKEAIMEPLRKCRTARYFRKTGSSAAAAAGGGGTYLPVEADPPCSSCTPDLPSRPAPRRVPCRVCGCERADMFDFNGNELAAPDVCMEDFDTVLKRARPTVAPSELKRYDEFTKQFGVEGS
jgi:vacuolar protein-sorting-associated protein 4